MHLPLVLVIGLLGIACSDSGDKNAGQVGSTSSTAPATTSSTATPATCPKLRPAGARGAPANLADLQMVSPTKGFAVGKGAILVTDDGKAWAPRYTGAAAFGTVDAISATHAWATGDRALYRTTDGGKTWRGAGNPDDGTVLRQVHFIDENFGWGVGRNGKLYRSGDAGSTWGELSAPCGAESVCFTAQDDGWVAVGNRVARSTNGGDSWTPVFTVSSGGPSPGESFHIERLQCTKGGAVWAQFTGEDAAMSHAPYVVFRGSADGQWTPVLKETMTGPSDVAAPSGGSYPGPMSTLGPDAAAFVFFTPPGEPPVSLAVATDNGRRVGPARPVPGLTSPEAASFLSADTGWVLGTKATDTGASGSRPPSIDAILATTDGGQTWEEQFTRPAPAR
jgi:photosystem II stability/assembly factor-like uncharacterized protein